MKNFLLGNLMRKFIYPFFSVLFFSSFAYAQLAVTVSVPKLTGQKAVVALAMRNGFTQKIQSARASVFLLDENGKMVGKTSQWIIGGSANKLGLAAGGTNIFNVVITGSKPFAATNLTANINFSRVILANGESANPNKTVQITCDPK